MIHNPYIRILYTGIAVVAAVVFPYWLALLVITGGCFLFEWYAEAFAVSLYMDSIYAAPLEHLHHFMLLYTLITLFIFIILMIAKKSTRYGIS